MFTNILVPVDGSEVSTHAAAYAVKLARATGARITALHVAEPYRIPVRDDDGSAVRDYVSPERHAAQIAATATRYLDAVRQVAGGAGVECAGQDVADALIAGAIVEAAGVYGCDGIVIGSHGHSGLRKLLLGSETQKVLASTTLPVLVVR